MSYMYYHSWTIVDTVVILTLCLLLIFLLIVLHYLRRRWSQI
nr:P6 protein [Rose spring dwarf-associated virus]